MSEQSQAAPSPETIPAGPYLAVANFCERAIEDKNGIFSLIGLVDQLTIALASESPEPSPERPLVTPTILFLGFKWLDFKAEKELRLRLVAPRGEAHLTPPTPIHFEGAGANVVVNLGLEVRGPGLYWVEVFLEEELLTRVPLRIAFERQPVAGRSDAVSPWTRPA